MENWLVWKKSVIFGVFDQHLEPQKFTFASENGQKRPNEWGSGKVKNNNVTWDVANNRYADCLFQKKL